jgi:lysozyme
MVISAFGRQFIQGWEKFRSKPYDDGYGYITWGWGHRQRKGETPPKSISQSDADVLFESDLKPFVYVVNKVIKVPLTQIQFDMLVSLCFNVGVGAFSKSKLVRALNSYDYFTCFDEFISGWDHSNGQYSRGLHRRRVKERQLFFGIVSGVDG